MDARGRCSGDLSRIGVLIIAQVKRLKWKIRLLEDFGLEGKFRSLVLRRGALFGDHVVGGDGDGYTLRIGNDQ